MKKAIVTGANGFVGAAVTSELLQHGWEVFAVVRNESSDLFRLSAAKSNLHVIYSEMSNYKSLTTDMLNIGKLDLFYHFAWEGCSGSKRSDPSCQMANIEHSLDAIRLCSDIRCKRFVMACSIMEYEVIHTGFSGKPLTNNSIYSSAKLAADLMGKALADSLGIEYLRGIISNIYGPGETNPRFINTTIKKMLSGEYCVFTSGKQMYDFIYISDAARAFYYLGIEGIRDKQYYIGGVDNPKPLREFILELRDQIDKDIKVGLGQLPDSKESLDYHEFDIHALEKDTRFVPKVSFKEGINRTIQYYKEKMNGII